MQLVEWNGKKVAVCEKGCGHPMGDHKGCEGTTPCRYCACDLRDRRVKR
jgi:hypothetical protein